LIIKFYIKVSADEWRINRGSQNFVTSKEITRNHKQFYLRKSKYGYQRFKWVGHVARMINNWFLDITKYKSKWDGPWFLDIKEFSLAV